MWGIASGESADTVEQYVDNLGVSFPILLDSDNSVRNTYHLASAFPSAAYPQDWVIGSDWVIVYVNNGFEIDAIQSAIAGELDGD